MSAPPPGSVEDSSAKDQGSNTEQGFAEANQAGEEPESHHENAGVPRPVRGSGRGVPFLPNRGAGQRRGADYGHYYPPDELGAQMGPNARVWRVYLDEADEYDAEMIESFRDTTDVLLVFAGLFSAVVTTFVSQASQALQPDYAQVTAALMTELVSLQRAIATGASVAEITPSQLSYSNADTAMSFDHWVSGLWFTSLSLSLVSALLAVLVKQWLHNYISALSGTPRDRVLIRHFRFTGLRTWRVPEIIDTLPVLLHTSLFMFMAGLVMFVWTRDLTIASVILGITTTCLLFYSLSHLLAFLYPSCSYKTPISEVSSYIWIPFRTLASLRLKRDHRFFISYIKPAIRTGKQRERHASNQEMDSVLLSAIRWLYRSSSNSSARVVAAQSGAGVPLWIEERYSSSIQYLMTDILYSEPQSLQEHELGVALMAYSAVDPSPWLSEHYLTAYTAMRPTAPPSVQCLAAFLYPSGSGPDRGLVSTLNFDEILLPPWMWTSLFEKGTWDHTSDPLKLLVVLLDVMRKSWMTDLTVALTENKQTGWDLPPTVRLLELCRMERRMAIPIYRFACQLLSGPSADAIRRKLDALKEQASANPHTGPPALVHFAHGILDQFEARLEVTGSMAIDGYFTAVERALLSLHADHWVEPTFLDALHRCIVLKNRMTKSSDDVANIRLYHRQPVAESTMLLLLYILDILQHPWPASRVSDHPLPYRYHFPSLCVQLFSKQEREIFEAFIHLDGFPTFRRCFPFCFTDNETAGQLCAIFIPYIEFVTGLDDRECQSHLAVISEPPNLAWLMWLSLFPQVVEIWPRTIEYSGRITRNRFCQLLPALPIERQAWMDAARVLIEELRKDSALFGLGKLSYFYPYLKEGLEVFGLGSDCRLYGYASPAVDYPKDFSRVDDEGSSTTLDPMFGPFAVYFSPQTFPKPIKPTIKNWVEMISGNVRRITHIVTDLEHGGGAVVGG